MTTRQQSTLMKLASMFALWGTQPAWLSMAMIPLLLFPSRRCLCIAYLPCSCSWRQQASPCWRPPFWDLWVQPSSGSYFTVISLFICFTYLPNCRHFALKHNYCTTEILNSAYTLLMLISSNGQSWCFSCHSIKHSYNFSSALLCLDTWYIIHTHDALWKIV